MRREGEDLVAGRLLRPVPLMIGSWRKEVVGNIIYQSAEVAMVRIYDYWMDVYQMLDEAVC